jgi:xeroderma pigmentosum group C-complementing protein
MIPLLMPGRSSPLPLTCPLATLAPLPSFILERNIKRDQVVHPKVQHSLFRGEPVYRTSSLHACKTRENWMRSGREIREGEEPVKWVKLRAVTIGRRREMEALKEETGEQAMQGMFIESQTKLWRAESIKEVSLSFLSICGGSV